MFKSQLKKSVVLLILTIVAVDSKAFQSKDKLVGNILKSTLETYHYKKLSIDDSVSQKAFAEYLKKIDFGKQFLLEKDVKRLEKFQFKLDDFMVSGDKKVVDESMKLVSSGVQRAEGFRKEFFKKGFNFDKKESLELDPEKRSFPKNIKQQKELWRKIFKQATLSRYLDILQEQEDLKKEKLEEKTAKSKKDKKNKKSKKDEDKILSPKEALEKANEAIGEKYEKLFARILKDDADDFREKVFNSVSEIFDPHTVYLPPKKKEDFDIDISGSLEGIGAVLSEDGSYIKVVSIVPGGAAWRQKELEAEDLIISVSQGKKGKPVSLVDMRVDDAVRYIRGKKGTIVKLTVKKVDGTRKTISIVRDVVKISESYVKSSIIEHKKLGQKIGYIRVPKFYRDFNGQGRNCSEDVRKELLRLKKIGLDGVVLDLRNNGGGALEDARIMSGLFIKEGPIVQIRNHKGATDVLKDYDPSVVYGGPLVVMINRFSASASEILAGALQDYKRAVIVGGEFSHGKGTVQAVLNLNQAPLLKMFGPTMGALKVTIQKFYRINGSSTQYKGITPDIILPDPMGYAKNREQDLDYSLKWDQVAKLDYELWDGPFYDLKKLKRNSERRVKKNERIKKVKGSVDYLVSKREDTIVSLNEKVVKKEDKKREEVMNKFKIEDPNKMVLVTNFEDALSENEEIKKQNKKKWEEDVKRRKSDWEEELQKDTLLEETLFIMNDMISSAGSKVSKN